MNSGMITCAARMKTAVIAPSAISMIQNTRRGEPERLALAALLQQLGEDRHEGRRERRVGEQVADQVRDLEGDRERRVGCAACRRSCAAMISRTRPAIREKPGGDREDRGVAGDATVRPRCRASARWGRSAQGRYSTAPRGLRPPRLLPWPTSPPRRSGSCAPSASGSRIAATPRRSRPTSAASRRPSPPATSERVATEHRTLVSLIDKAIKTGALHRNTGARKKSRAARIVRPAPSAEPPPPDAVHAPLRIGGRSAHATAYAVIAPIARSASVSSSSAEPPRSVELEVGERRDRARAARARRCGRRRR